MRHFTTILFLLCALSVFGAAPNAPTNFRTDPKEFFNDGDGKELELNFKWELAASDALGFVLQFSTNSTTFYNYASYATNILVSEGFPLKWNSNFWFRVGAYNGSGTNFSTSNAVFGCMPPAGLTLASPATNKVLVSWIASGAPRTNYVVEVDTNSNFSTPTRYLTDGSGNTLTNVVDSEERYTFTNTFSFLLYTNYYFRVRAASTNGNTVGYSEVWNSPYSYLGVAPNGVPATPGFVSLGCRATSTNSETSTTTRLLFDDQALNETGFWLDQSNSTSAVWTSIPVTFTGETRYDMDINNLFPGRTYYYRLAATNTLGPSTYTNFQITMPQVVAAAGITNWYIDPAATSGNSTGTNMANAWLSLGAINQYKLGPGHTIWISGGTTGRVYNDYLITYTDGATNNPITIKPATNSSHTGDVIILGEIATRSKWTTVDGSRSSTYTVGNTRVESITNNIRLRIKGRGDNNPGISCPTAFGTVFRWIEVTEHGNPLANDSMSGVELGCATIGPIATVIEYCWIHDNWGSGISASLSSAAFNTIGAWTLSHSVIEQNHNNFISYQGGMTVSNSVLRDKKFPGIAHPDGLQGGMDNVIIVNSRIGNAGGSLFYPNLNGQSNWANVVIANNIWYNDETFTDTTGMDWQIVLPDSSFAVSTLSNVWVVGNTFYGRRSLTVAFVNNSQPNRFLRDSGFLNNFFYSGVDCSTGNNAFTSGGMDYATNDFQFDGNIAAGPTKQILYDSINYANAEALVAALPSFTNNTSKLPSIVDLTSLQFGLLRTNTVGLNVGVSLAAATNKHPSIAYDYFGVRRDVTTKPTIGAIQNDPGLVSWLRFENDFYSTTNSYVVDSSGNMADGQRFGRPASKTNYPGIYVGPEGSAAAFFRFYTNDVQEGQPQYFTGDYIGIYNSNLVSGTTLTSATFAVWVWWSNRIDSVSATYLAAGLNDDGNFRFGLDGLTDVTFTMATNGALIVDNKFVRWLADDNITNQWHHYAVTYSNKTGIAYYDGVPIQTNTLPTAGNLIINGTYVGIGCWTFQEDPWIYPTAAGGPDNHPNNGWHNGAMDDWRFYSRALTATDIAAIYGGGATSGSGGGAPESPSFTTNAIFAITNPLPITQMVQVVRFTIATNSYTATNTALFDDSGNFVPYQQGSSNQVFFRAGLLPNSTNRFYFVSGVAPTNISGVFGYLGLSTNSSASIPWQYQVTNGMHTGFRIVNPTVASYSNAAPIQGFQLRNGHWVNGETGTNGTNFHYVSNGDDGTPAKTICWSNMTVTVVDAGPIYTELLFEGTYRRSTYTYLGSIEQWPAGPGFFKCRVMMSALEPGVIVENYNNDAGYYRFDASPGMAADEFRYRGHSASSDANGVLFGFGGDFNDAPYHFDLIVSIAFGATNLASRQRDELGNTSGIMAASYNFPVFIRDAGIWNLMCDTNSAASSPTLGFANIRQSSGLGGVTSANSPRLGAWSTNNGKFGIEFGTQVYANTTTPMALQNARARWLVYFGTNGSVINSSNQPGYIQPEIMPLWARHYALDIDKIKGWNLGWTESLTPGGFYMVTNSVITNYIAPIKGGNTALYDELKLVSGSEGDLILNLWRTNSSLASTATLSQAIYTADGAFNLFTNWLTGDANQASRFNSLQGGQLLGRIAPVLDAILGDGNASTTVSNQSKAWIALIGNFVRDNDFTPIDNYVSNAVNLGTANMGPQYTAFRGAYSIGFTNHPIFGTNAFADYLASSNTLTTILNAYGASIGSPHYAGASVQPIYANLLQARVRGWTNALYGRLQRHADWNIQSSTPRDPRFGSSKLVVFGNGYPSANGFNGMLAGAFYDGVDNALASKLLYRWNQEGKPTEDYFFPSFIMIPRNYSAIGYTVRSQAFPGYWTVHRAQNDTTNRESAFWLINGSYYSDHRINPDTGNYNWFPMQVPASVQWGSIYYPEIESQLFGNILTESAAFPSWNSSNVYSEALTWSEPQGTQTNNILFAFSSWSDAHYTNTAARWARDARTFDYFQNMSLLELKDFKNNASNYTASYMLMSTGGVVFPAVTSGQVPTFVTNDVSGARNMPTTAHATIVPFPLSAGTNRFGFTGVTWVQAPSNGIDIALMLYQPNTNEAALMGWSHSYIETTSGSQYNLTNNATRYFEQQQILRVKGTNNPHALQVAYRKNTTAPTITTNGLGGWSVSQGTEFQNVYTNHTEYSRNGLAANALAVWGFTNAVTATNGIGISGGPTEVAIENTNSLTLSLAGNTGLRVIDIPSYATNRYGRLRPVASGRNAVIVFR